MKGTRLFLLVGTAVVGIAYLVFSAASRPTRRDTQMAQLTDDFVIGEPLTFQNLTIFPITSKTPRNVDRFITLDEGLQAGTIEIVERGAVPSYGTPPQGSTTEQTDPFAQPSSPPAADPFGAPPATGIETDTARSLATDDPFADSPQDPRTPPGNDWDPVAANAVNELVVINHSDKPLYLMPGEIVVGGSQDRTIGQELVIAPDNKPVAIGVYCVESGRWGGRDQQTYAQLLEATGGPTAITANSANLSLVVSETTELANAGKFVGSIGSLNKSARIAVQSGEGQGKVWEEVATENGRNRVQPPTGTFASNYLDVNSTERLSLYLEKLQRPIEETENIVGVIVAVNGEMESMDVFESTPLFRKLWPKLLKSYALDAASGAEDGQEVAGQVAAQNDAVAFFHEVAQARGEMTDTSCDLALSKGENDHVLLFSAHERRNVDVGGPALGGFGGSGMGGMGGGSFGSAIHNSGFAK